MEFTLFLSTPNFTPKGQGRRYLAYQTPFYAIYFISGGCDVTTHHYGENPSQFSQQLHNGHFVGWYAIYQTFQQDITPMMTSQPCDIEMQNVKEHSVGHHNGKLIINPAFTPVNNFFGCASWHPAPAIISHEVRDRAQISPHQYCFKLPLCFKFVLSDFASSILCHYDEVLASYIRTYVHFLTYTCYYTLALCLCA